MTTSKAPYRPRAPRGWTWVGLALVAWGLAIGCARALADAFVAAITIIGG